MNRILIIITTILLLSNNVFGQLQYDEYDDVISFSYIYPEIDNLKANNKINSLQLPAFNNDSLYWINNAKRLDPKNKKYDEIAQVCGFVVDTTINFFKVATKVEIKEGYVWLYKITSPTAFSLGIDLKNIELNSEEYLCAHSNFHDSIDYMYQYRRPEVYTGDFIQESIKKRPIFLERGYPISIFGNSLYIEVFSPNESLQNSGLIITSWSYYYQ